MSTRGDRKKEEGKEKKSERRPWISTLSLERWMCESLRRILEEIDTAMRCKGKTKEKKNSIPSEDQHQRSLPHLYC